MSNYQLFRSRMNKEVECVRKMEARFITDSAASIVITIQRLGRDQNATMVFTDAEGPDTAIVFTPKQANTVDNLLKTDYFTWNDKMFFVYEDVLVPREVNYIKQRAYQCNVQVLVDGQNIGCAGYFMSSLRSYVDTEFQQKINITDKEKPILIIPRQEWVKYGTKLIIGDKPWKIIDYDAITNPGIVYISLERSFISKGSDIIRYAETHELVAGETYTFQTVQGFFNSSSPLIIKSRKANEVICEVPHGLTEVEISVDSEIGIQTKHFKVVV